MDSNHRRHCQQIYSLSPLATREFPHIIPVFKDFTRKTYQIIEICFPIQKHLKRLAARRQSIVNRSELSPTRGAGGRTRTPDLLITNQLLYQLSYTSISATEWILADAAPFVKPKFFIFREEGLLHFKICSPAEKRRPYGRPCGRCSLCGCELLRGERGWYLNGQSVCADCFPAFARAELAPCETVFGMEGEA